MMKLVVLSCVLAMASAGALISPLTYATPYAYPAAIAYTAPLLTPSNYRGPLSLAPGQPANIIAADGRPLDTLDVNLDRAAHFTKKAFETAGIHLLKKRSAPVIAPLPISPIAVAPAPLISSAPFLYSSPAISTPIATAPLAYSQTSLVHILKKRSAPLITPLPLNQVALTSAPFISSAPIIYSSPAISTQFTYTQAPLLQVLKKRDVVDH